MGRSRERSRAWWASSDRHPAEADRHPAEADRHPAEADRHPAEADRHPAEADRHPAPRGSYTELMGWAADQVHKLGARKDTAALKTPTRRLQWRSMRRNRLWPKKLDRDDSFHLTFLGEETSNNCPHHIRFSDGKGHLLPDHPSAAQPRAGMSAKQRALQAYMHGSSGVCRAAAIPPRGSRGHR